MILRSVVIPKKRTFFFLAALAVVILLAACNIDFFRNALSNKNTALEVNAGAVKMQDPGEAKNNFQDTFFVDYRLSRDQARSRRIEFLKEIACSQIAAGGTNEEAQKELLNLFKLIEKEAQLENLVAAHGFKDSVVLLEQDTATVVVETNAFSLEDKNMLVALVAKIAGLNKDSVFVFSKHDN